MNGIKPLKVMMQQICIFDLKDTYKLLMKTAGMVGFHLSSTLLIPINKRVPLH